MMYILIALLSAFFAAITTILCKCGLRDADSDAATALRTTIVLVLSIAVVWITGEWHDLPNVTGMTLLFLILSGCATGGSWLCYFKALKTGDVNRGRTYRQILDRTRYADVVYFSRRTANSL